MIRNFNADGLDSLYPRYSGGRPKRFTLSERREIKKIAKSRPAEHGLPFSTWSLAKLADFLVTERRVAATIITLVCRSCGAVKDVDCVVGHPTCLDPVDDAGYLVDEADVTFWGLWPQCRPEIG